jgi:hypothetical protein
MAWLRLNRPGTSLNVATFKVGKPGSGSVLPRRGLGPGAVFASLTTLGSRLTLIPPSDGTVRPMMLSHRRVRCKTLRPHDCPLALISLSPKRVPPLGAFSPANPHPPGRFAKGPLRKRSDSDSAIVQTWTARKLSPFWSLASLPVPLFLGSLHSSSSYSAGVPVAPFLLAQRRSPGWSFLYRLPFVAGTPCSQVSIKNARRL